MKLFKLLLSSMFVFIATVQKTEVGMCGGYKHHYEGINASFVVKDETGQVITYSSQCGANWIGIKKGIQYQLKTLQASIDADRRAIEENKQMIKESKEIVGAEVRGE